jgi:hypothetical protein
MEGVESVGFNQWDEVAESGYVDVITGVNTVDASRYRSKNYILVFPSTEYYFKNSVHAIANNVPFRLYFYDADKSFISVSSALYFSQAFTTPANAHYMRFFVNEALSNFDNTICINLSDPDHNGEYEPYWQSVREIPVATYFPDGMRSAGTVRDELTADAAITRVGARAYTSGDESDATLKTDGTTTYYQLATPTVTEIDPPLNLDYKVSDFGTERVQHTEPTAPVPMEIAYGIDAAATLASLPTDYISHASMARFISAVEQHFGVTVTETWDDTNKRYDYTIGA